MGMLAEAVSVRGVTPPSRPVAITVLTSGSAVADVTGISMQASAEPKPPSVGVSGGVTPGSSSAVMSCPLYVSTTLILVMAVAPRFSMRTR